MHRTTSTRVIVAASLAAVAGSPLSVLAQDAPPTAVPVSSPTPAPDPPESTAPAPVPPPPAPAAAVTARDGISFNFKDTPFDMVLDFFSRECGLPIIREAAVPAGAMTFIGASVYSFEDALSILNLNLAMHGVQLRRQDQFLYLSTMQDAAKKPGKVATGEVPADARPEQFLTLTIPLDNASAAVVAEQIKGLVGPFGAVTAVPQQNIVIVMETAAQCRRIRDVVQAIDVKQVDTQFQIFALKNAQADAVFSALRGLMGERVRQTFVDKDGKQTTVQDISVSGLQIQPDLRTNSIIAVGSASKLRVCQELIALLDTPDVGGGDAQMVTLRVLTISTEDAAAKVSSLFSTVPANRKPVVLPHPQAGKVTLIGSRGLVAQAIALLGEIDPGGGAADAGEEQYRAAVVKLKFITAQQVEQVATRLLTPRQAGMVKFAPTPDGKGMIVTGPAADVGAFEQILSGLDVPAQADREVRLMRIATGDPAAVVEKAKSLYEATGKAERDPISVSVDAASRSVTLVGSRVALSAFDALLTSAQSSVVVETESRTFQLTKVKPSVMAPRLSRVLKPLLTPDDGSEYREPVIEPVDDFGTLIVRAAPKQLAVVEQIVKRLDGEEGGARELRVVKLGGVDTRGVIERAQKMYAERTKGLPETEAGPVTAEYDTASGSVLISASSGGMRLFTEVLTQAQQLAPPARSTRIVEIANVPAKDLVAPLAELLKSAEGIDPSRTPPEPSIQVLEKTNSLVVTAEDAQHRAIADLITRLDRIDRSNLPPLKLLQVRTADAANISQMLTQQYGQRPQAERSAKPVDIRSDAATNTLIVSAHPDLFNEIKAFVEDINKEKKEGPERVTQLFPLKVAKAVDVAAAMDKLYPLPPVPVDRLNRPMPWLQKAKEVTVSAEPSSNSLIIDAPADRLESLQTLAAQLDRVEMPASAQLRTYRIIGADLGAIAQTLNALARQGTLSTTAQAGKPAVQVLIETEPKSSTLIVAGDETTFERVEAMLKDLQAVPVEKGLRVFPVAFAKAGEIKDRAQAIYNAQIAQLPGANPVELSIDESTNSLLAVADTEAMQRFAKVIEELQRQAGPAREVRMIELRNAKAAEVIDFLRDMIKSSKSMQIRGGPDPVIEPIEATNTILVAAQPVQFAIIEQLVRSLDSQRSADRPPMRILSLRSTDAANLAQVLQQSYDRRPIDQKSKQPVDIQADPATNTLIVSAHPEVLPEIEAIITQLNEQQSVDADGREIRIFPLKVARAEELAKTIDQMFPEPPMPRDPRTGQPRPDLQRAREVVVRADRGTNALIVDAPAKRLAGFEQIVKNLDQQKLAENVELRTYRVERSDLPSVATTLRNLAANGTLFGGKQPSGAATVTVDTEAATRTLIVSGPAEVFPQVEAVLKQLDSAPNKPATGLKMYPLKHARAERLQTLLDRVLATRLREQEAVEGRVITDIKSLLEVSADPASNTLLVSAPETVQQIAEELIKSLDNPASETARAVVRVLPLAYAEATQLAQTLNQTLPGIELPTGGKVSIVAAPGSNALLLSGADADLAKIEELVRPLDVRPTDAAAPKVETFALVHTDAALLSQVVQRLLSDQQETDPKLLSLKLQYSARNRPDLFKPPAVRVEADTKTNTLIVSAPSATLELAKELITRLDQPQTHTDRIAMTYTPAKGNPAELAASAARIVNATVPQGRVPAELVAEAKSGSILILGTKEQVAESVKQLSQLDDRSMVLPPSQLEVFPVANADATVLAGTLQQLLADRTRWPEELKQAERAGLTVPQPTVNADARSNRILISVPAALMPIARELVGTLDRPQQQSVVEVRVFSLVKGEAASIATALKAGLDASAKPGEPKPTITAEAASNSVIVTGSPAAVRQAEALIKPMDESVQPDGLGVRTVFLKHARAEAIAPVLEAVLTRESALDGLPMWARAQVIQQRGGKEPEKTRVSAEKRLNAVVVSGPVATLELAEQVISELDVDPALTAGTRQRAMRIITLQNADATELASGVSDLFVDDASEQAPTVRVDKSSNSLIVRATSAQMEAIESLATKLDSATLAASRQLRMVPIDRSRADAQLMAETLKRLLEQQGGVKVEIISTEELLKKSGGQMPVPKPQGSAESHRSRPSDGLRLRGIAGIIGVTIVSSAFGAVEVPQASSVPAQAPAAVDAAQDDASVTIAVDPVSNTLVILGSPRLTDRLAGLAQELERQMPSEPAAVRVVTLPPSVDARQITQLLAQTITQVGRASPGNPGGFSGPVSVLPDPAGAAIVVLANDTDFKTVGQLITAVSQLNTAVKLTVKVYPLASVTAARAAGAIEDLLSVQPRGAQAQRVRQLEMTVAGPDGRPVVARLDPTMVRVTPDPSGATVIVAAPEESMAVIDRFVALIDQSPVTDRLAIRRYALANARAADLSKTLQTLMDAQRQGPAAQELPKATFASDERSNSMLVTASEPQHAEIRRLLEAADLPVEDGGLELAILPLQQATPATVQKIVEEVVVGRDPGKKEKIRISAVEGSNLFVVRAGKEDLEQIRGIVARIDSSETTGLPVRSIKLERADAQSVATALQKFFVDRAAASSRPGQRTANRVAVIGDRRSGSLVVAASDEDFEQIKTLAGTFDTPGSSHDMQFKIIALKNARVMDIQPTLTNIADQLAWERAVSRQQAQQEASERLLIEPNERTNSLVLVGTAESILTAEKVIASLDVAPSDRAVMSVRAVAIENADPAAIKQAIERAMVTPGWRTWRGPDPDAVSVEVDRKRRAVVLVGKTDRVETALGYVKELDSAGAAGRQEIRSLQLRNARADRAANSLRQFFTERARATGQGENTVSVIGSADGNVLIVSADERDTKVIEDLVAQIDQPDLGKDRRFDIFYLKNSSVQEAAQTLRAMFGRAGGEEQVVVTPQPSTNSLIVSAPTQAFEQVAAIVKQIDQPPTAETANMVTVSLSAAKATEVATAIKAALPPNVKVTITPVSRSNSLLLTGSDEAINVVLDQIRKIDTEPVKSLFAFRRVRLEHAMADDVYFTLSQMLRSRPRGDDGRQQASVDYSRADNTLTVSAPQDQIDEIEQVIKQLDTAPTVARKTEFVKLQFADAVQTGRALEVFFGRYAPEASTPAARNVTILPDSASNSLVISADSGEWDRIKLLLEKLDTKDYDTSRQLAVIHLTHADATSVARALNDGFREPDSQARRQQDAARRRAQDDRDSDFIGPMMLANDERPSVSAESVTNSIIVFAGRRDLERVQSIVGQLDVPGFANMPEPRVIPLTGTAKPSALATSIREMFTTGAMGQQKAGPRSVVILGDDVSGALIVRAEETQFAQIKALADTLQQKGEMTRLAPEVVRLKHVPAARLRATILATFTPLATQMGETFAVEVDRGSNSLVVMCSPRLKAELTKVIAELDVNAFADEAGKNGADASRLGQSVFIADVVNNSPEDIKKILDEMGLSKAQAPDRPGVVAEPVTIVPMTTRRALAILASPGDGQAVVELVKAMDTEPVGAEQKVAVIALKKASAQAVITTLKLMLSPEQQDAQTGPADALKEHVRRLAIASNSLEKPEVKLDLAVPIRLVPDTESNSIVIASTPGNVETLKDVIKTLDTLPVGDSVIVRMFPLANASASRTKVVVDELFAQGEVLRRLPGTNRRGLPTTATGQALAGEIAVSVDERTNLLIVAGREEAVAFVEVLVKELDSDEVSKWIEPVIVPVQYADAVTLAQRLRAVLVQGVAATPEAMGLQRQFGRLRMLSQGKTLAPPKEKAANGIEAPKVEGALPDLASKPTIEADLFAPITGLVITPDEQTNSLIIVGTPNNIAVVRQLVAMLDVERASASNSVQVYPLKFAAADRIAAVVQDVFRQREASGSSRPEDRVIVTADSRTNAIIVSTSPRSYAILETLLKTLDGEQSRASVGLHVIAVSDADAKSLAPRIEKLMKERIDTAIRSGSVKNPADAFSVEAEPVNNLLIVAASDENFAIVKELLSALTEDAKRLAAADRTDIIQLSKVPAREVVESLKELYLDKEVAKRGQGAVSAIPNDRLNAIIVGGTDQDIAEIRQLVAQIDTTQVRSVRRVDRIELKTANALEVVRLVENVLAGRPVSGTTTGVGTRQATKLQFFRENIASNLIGGDGAPTEADIDGVIRDQVTLTPDLRSNSVMVAAPPQVAQLIRELIVDLDSTSAGSRRIEEFRLVNADARQMAELLRDAFNLRQQGQSYVLVPTQAAADADAQPQEGQEQVLTGTTVTAVPDERQQLSIAIDARTNTLIVSGTEQYLELVKKVVTKLDGIEATERERTIYHLANSKAKDMEQTLQRYFRGELDTQKTTLGPQLSGSLMRQLEQEVTVIGDEKSNKLVISTAPRFTESVIKIVRELDTAPPQVMIQVLLAEVTIDNQDDWGMDFKVGPFGGDDYVGEHNVFGLGGVGTALGIPNLSVSSTDFSLLIRALQAQGKLEVLSNPQLLVSNNEVGKIQVGDDIAIVTGVQTFAQGNSLANTERKDIGIILNVTPNINNDGFVRMEIKPEISTLSARTTEISEDFQAPVITKRTLDTIVTVKDGQSVVIGGLIQSTDEMRKTKVPLLGDIPVIGLPFRTETAIKKKTELLVVLTPRIVPGSAPGEAETTTERVNYLTNQAIDRFEDPSKIRQYIRKLQEDPNYEEPATPRDPEMKLPAPAPMNSPAPESSPRQPQGAAANTPWSRDNVFRVNSPAARANDPEARSGANDK